MEDDEDYSPADLDNILKLAQQKREAESNEQGQPLLGFWREPAPPPSWRAYSFAVVATRVTALGPLPCAALYFFHCSTLCFD